jgi:hypothetical protein
MRQIEELKKNQVRVGFQQGENSEDGVDMVDIAMFNELGTVRSPSRPFMRESVEQNKGTIEKFCKSQLQKVVQGGTAQQCYNAVGAMQKGLIQDTISKSKTWAAANAESTIQQKGSDQPLVDTGRMVQSVGFVIKPKE